MVAGSKSIHISSKISKVFVIEFQVQKLCFNLKYSMKITWHLFEITFQWCLTKSELSQTMHAVTARPECTDIYFEKGLMIHALVGNRIYFRGQIVVRLCTSQHNVAAIIASPNS